MGSGADIPLTPLELRIMQALWSDGAGTVAEIQERLEPRLAYTTVQTMLNILVRKKKLKRQLRGRAFVYRAAVTEDKALAHALRDLVERMFGGSSEDLVLNLVKTRQLDAKRLAALTERLEREQGNSEEAKEDGADELS